MFAFAESPVVLDQPAFTFLRWLPVQPREESRIYRPARGSRNFFPPYFPRFHSFSRITKISHLILQIFSRVDILFSIGGKYYTGEPITYTYMEDKIFESSRNITIKLHHRVGKYVKLRLHFSDRWIMISEVTFDSGKRTEVAGSNDRLSVDGKISCSRVPLERTST